jgi:hypothetical protein
VKPFLTLIIVALLSMGCNRRPDLVGKWSTSYKGEPSTLNLTVDSKVELDTKMPADPPVDVKITGTWSFTETLVTLNFTDEPTVLGAQPRMLGVLTGTATANFKKTMVFKYSLNSDGTITLTSQTPDVPELKLTHIEGS